MVNLLKRPVSRWALLLLLAAFACSAWVLKLQWHWPWATLFAAPDTLPLDALMVQNNTLPRMAMALLAGGSLALATMLLQQIMRNPLASDSTLAVSSGAQTALVAATVFAPALTAYGNAPVAFGGSAAALAMVLWLSARRELVPLMVVLAGLVTSLYLGAVTGIVTLFYSEETRGIMLWGSGSLLQDSWHDSTALLWRILAAVAVLALLVKPLAMMSLSDDQAAALGIPVKTIRLAALAVAAFLSANVVGMVGMMGFIGLAAATAVRQLGVRTLWARLSAAFVFGALMLLLTDNLLILLNHYRQIDLPAGAVTGLIGAPLLLWLMMRTPARSAIQTASAQTVARLQASPLLRMLPLLLLLAVALALFCGQGADGWQFAFHADLLALRYPRLLTAAACGIMLAVTGVLLQRLTQNPMASPELLGISSGTAFGVMTAVLVFDIPAGSSGFWLAGIASALAALWLIMLFNRKSGLQPEKVLLTGIAVAALADAFIRVWSAGGDLRIQQLLVWLSGSTYQAAPLLSGSMLALALILLLATLPLSRWLGLLSLNATVAQSAGVHVAAARITLIMFSALLTALATLLIGPLSFVGLLAPHLANMLGARLPKQQLFYAALIGATVMTLADWLGRQIGFPYEIPAGLMATLLGGGYFLLMMRRM
ncbi:Fe(3+)-hydroxamate ABC transporter permease FhuB [Uruburuella testudinis]|uniref:Fe(3+)-hydroxamate ABC transporter permease FhuB n=1 Tax=Uruburuella testudinis TaxID=1282863 RepID=A0ABY4DP12_9NEIS|nr:Fe(3+)-hydroxamate ABC transporter permease FhuB [Uruburuella testudinis]UOO80792.1 Fe(3+)-hydroxamate ABC transporter permease FhuB [Uruburuella testudinis]